MRKQYEVAQNGGDLLLQQPTWQKQSAVQAAESKRAPKPSMLQNSDVLNVLTNLMLAELDCGTMQEDTKEFYHVIVNDGQPMMMEKSRANTDMEHCMWDFMYLMDLVVRPELKLV